MGLVPGLVTIVSHNPHHHPGLPHVHPLSSHHCCWQFPWEFPFKEDLSHHCYDLPAKSWLVKLADEREFWIKGLRPVLEGFVVPMHEGACETGSQIPRDLTYCSHKPECIGTTNPDRSVLITIITWHFQFHPVNVSNLCIKDAYVLEARAVSRAPPIVTSRGAH